MYRDLDNTTQPGRDSSERPSPSPKERQPETNDDRTVYDLREKSYRLNDREARMLADIGKFRAVEKRDLLRNIYQGQQQSFDRDLKHIHRQNLVRIVGPKDSHTKYIVLTKPAKELAEKHLGTNPRQEIHAGVVKTREMKHDAALYRLYHKAVEDIEKHRGRPLRVVLDFELKRDINRARAKAKALPHDQQQQKLKEIADHEHLKMVNGKIPLPDLRIEYENEKGDLSRSDLEYVTEDYRAQGIAEKRAAGFKLYGSDRRGRTPYGPDLMGGLIAL